jgi:hypothetical protein
MEGGSLPKEGNTSKTVIARRYLLKQSPTDIQGIAARGKYQRIIKIPRNKHNFVSVEERNE